MSYLTFSKRWAGYLSARTGLDPEKEAVLTYAIEVLVINLVNVAVTLTLGWLWGVFQGTLICLITVALFRHTAGGAHSKSPWRCALVTITVFPLLALLAKRLSLLSSMDTAVLSFAALLTGVIAIIRLAPVDSPGAPIISPVRKRKLKILSLSVMLLVIMLTIILRYSDWVHASEWQLCLVLGVLWVSFILSNAGHAFIDFIDGIKTGKERRCEER